jgi:hypothetical protein
MQSTKIRKVVLRNIESLLLSTGGLSIDVGLLGKNYHKIKLIACEGHTINEGVVSLLWIGTSYIALLSE